jgi:hypothetical protein
MVAIDLLSGLADLFDDEEVGLGLDDPFDSRLFVAGDHNEAVTLPHNLLVSEGAISIASKQEARSHSQWKGCVPEAECSLAPAAIPSFTLRKTSSLRAARSAESICGIIPPSSRALQSGQPRPSFLQQRGALVPINPTANGPSPLDPGAALDHNLK